MNDEENNNESNELVFIEQDNKTIEFKKNAKTFAFGLLGGLIGSFIVLAIVLNIPNVKEGINDGNKNEENKNILNNSNSTPISTVAYENPVEGVAAQVGPSVVGVTVSYSYNSFFGTQTAKQEGSGIIISSDGYILTNNHVIETNVLASEIKVYLPNSKDPLNAEIVGTDSETDIAILKIDCTDLPAVVLGNSSDLKVGEMVVAIGNPLGMEFAGSVTVGYVSALNREVTDSYGTMYNLIQTDAAINEGNSGGALVNTKGEVIGINVAKMGGTGVEGLCFAIPIDDVKDVINDLITYKKVIRPYLGIEGTTVDEATQKRYKLDAVGVYIRSVEEFSAAEMAGLKPGDIIVKFDGKTVDSMEKLNEYKNEHKVGDTIKITVVRQKQEKTFEVILKEQ